MKRLQYADKNGMVKCTTCDAVKHYKSMQAGHFLAGRGNSILFENNNVHPQCLTGDSNILMEDGSYKKIPSIIVGDKIIGFDEHSFERIPASVLSISKFIPTELFHVTMENGSKFYATGDHRIVVDGEWKTIEETLHGCTGREIMEP